MIAGKLWISKNHGKLCLSCPAQEKAHTNPTPHTSTAAAHQNRAQSRAEQSRAEQNRTEQNRTEQNRTEQSRAEQSRTEQGFRVRVWGLRLQG